MDKMLETVYDKNVVTLYGYHVLKCFAINVHSLSM